MGGTINSFSAINSIEERESGQIRSDLNAMTKSEKYPLKMDNQDGYIRVLNDDVEACKKLYKIC